MAITIPISPGELLDRLTILAIKAERIADAEKRRNVIHELAVTEEVRARTIPRGREIERLTDELRGVNAALWDIEDEIRDCERAGDFGDRFVELARSVYRTNDRRAALKRALNTLLASELVEEKSYAAY